MPKRIFLVFACVAVSFFSALSPIQAQVRDNDQTTAASLSSEAKLVTALDVAGNKSISTNTILSKMKTRVGSPYQETVINDDLKRLYLLGFFSDIKIDTEDYRGGVKIIISLVERPIIEKITFSGIKRLGMKDAKIKEALKSKETQYLDYPSLADDLKEIKKLYEKKGFSQIEVKHDVSIDKEKNKARVEFSVSEGKKIRVKEIFVEGNKNFTDQRILKIMKTKKAWLFNPGALKEDVLKEDLERIKAFYHRNGFIDAVVEDEVRPDKVRPFLYLSIKIKEGEKFLVGTVVVKGNQDVKESEIFLKIKGSIPGKVFSQEILRDDITDIQGLYFDRGYISVQIQEATSLNPKTGRIDIILTIVENEIAFVDKIKIKGNIKTKDVVIRRELRIKPGERFDGEKLRRSKERLQNLGFFEDISYDKEDTSIPNKKDLVVEVKETKTGSFSFGGGYSTVDQFLGFIELEQKNFDWRNFPYFTGAGQNLKLRFSAGTVTDGFDLSFTEPWMFNQPISAGFDLYKHTRKRESDIGYGYDENITGGDLRIGKELSEYVKGDVKYRFENIKIGNVDDSASQDLKDEVGQNNLSSMEFALSYDSRDNVFDTNKGDLLSGSFECAGGPFGGDKNFTKFYGRASHYIPLFRNSNLELRARVGTANAFGDTEKVPIYERFFAGGAYSIRGYNERKVGPIDIATEDPLGGDSLMIGNLEYTYPLFNFFKVAAFYDVGNVWSKAGDMGDGGFKSGVGVGVRIKTPIGPIMLDYGIPLNKEPGKETKGNGRFHFSMSHGF
ncbi:MAG: outer membrane protein assembly factor BamA [Candidatus Omnitrophota bacterium]|jgi:outer membrane protein insertion porin family